MRAQPQMAFRIWEYRFQCCRRPSKFWSWGCSLQMHLRFWSVVRVVQMALQIPEPRLAALRISLRLSEARLQVCRSCSAFWSSLSSPADGLPFLKGLVAGVEEWSCSAQGHARVGCVAASAELCASPSGILHVMTPSAGDRGLFIASRRGESGGLRMRRNRLSSATNSVDLASTWRR
jgi:hypothetical protein